MTAAGGWDDFMARGGKGKTRGRESDKITARVRLSEGKEEPIKRSRVQGGPLEEIWAKANPFFVEMRLESVPENYPP